ncbi:hypothetical protein [Microbacterium aureliae]
MRAAPRLALVAGLAVVLSIAAAGCRPEPSPSATGSPEPTPSIAEPTTGPSPTPIETNLPQDDALPERCEDVYSLDMLDLLDAENPPLNDPGVTMLSTEYVPLIEVIESGAPTLRCTWGAPSERGLSTNITVVDQTQEQAVLDTLRAEGFGCSEQLGGQLCEIEQRGVTFDDVEYVRGETHHVAEGLWVATSWINFMPDGYTTDIVAHLQEAAAKG